MFSRASTVFSCLAFAAFLHICESQVASLCRSNEVLRDCGGCQKTCRDPNPECTDICHVGCYCDGEDLLRDDNGFCVKYEDCPKKYHRFNPPAKLICRDDEVYEQCGVCDRTCDNPNPMCPAQCKRGCFCKDGLVREPRSGQCVHEESCQKASKISVDRPVNAKCEDDEVFEHCRPCEPSCEEPNPVCPAQCRRGCFCKPGFFRDLQTSRCVLPASCANRKDYKNVEKECGENETFRDCGICEPTCDNPKPICPAQCTRGCFCKDEFVRDERTNKCISLFTCPNTAGTPLSLLVEEECEDDEVFEYCRLCEASCEYPNPMCPGIAMCRRGCFCRQGLLRDLETNRCLFPASCPNYKEDNNKIEEDRFKHCDLCEPTCYNPKPICPAECKKEYFCKEEFVRDTRTYDCVPLSTCFSGTTIYQPQDEECEDDEVFEHCNYCEPSCEDPNPICPDQCRRGCFCKQGLFRDLQTNRCAHRTSCTNVPNITLSQPVENNCEDDEVFENCGVCEPSCEYPNPFCSDECERGCFCKPGLFRDLQNNRCVPPSNCPNVPEIPFDQPMNEECEDDEMLEECRPCEPSCEVPNPICPAQCRRGCFCRQGLFRDLQTNRCVLFPSCTNSV